MAGQVSLKPIGKAVAAIGVGEDCQRPAALRRERQSDSSVLSTSWVATDKDPESAQNAFGYP